MSKIDDGFDTFKSLLYRAGPYRLPETMEMPQKQTNEHVPRRMASTIISFTVPHGESHGSDPALSLSVVSAPGFPYPLENASKTIVTVAYGPPYFYRLLECA